MYERKSLKNCIWSILFSGVLSILLAFSYSQKAVAVESDVVFHQQPADTLLVNEVSKDDQVLLGLEDGVLARFTAYHGVEIDESDVSLLFYDAFTASWKDSGIPLSVTKEQQMDDDTAGYVIASVEVPAASLLVNTSLKIMVSSYESTEFQATCTYEGGVGVFLLQPGDRDFHRRSKAETISINDSDGRLAVLSKDVGVSLQVYDEGTGLWNNASVALSTEEHGGIYDVVAPELDASSDLFNRSLRLYTTENVASKPFVLACNTYEQPLPSPRDGMDASHQYGYTAGDTVYLVPDLSDVSRQNVRYISWQKSVDGGATYSDMQIVDLDTSGALSLSMEATCALTGTCYRYAVNASGLEASYSEPIELLVFERYSIHDGTLRIEYTGTDAMNDYGSSDRLSGLQPWKAEKGSIQAVSFAEEVQKVGTYAFSGCSSLTDVELGHVKVVGEGVFRDAVSLKHITFPASVEQIGASALKGCTGLLEVVIRNPDTVIDLSADTIPQISVDQTAPEAIDANKSLTEGMHTYPVIYGYRGMALDVGNGIIKKTAGSTAMEYAKLHELGFLPIGAIDAFGYERPVEWTTRVSGGAVVALSLSQSTRDALASGNGVDLYIPKTIDGYMVRTLVGIDHADEAPTCGLVEHEHTEDCEDGSCGLVEHEHNASCYDSKTFLTCTITDPSHTHDSSCYEAFTEMDVTGTYVGENRSVTFNHLFIPDTVTEIGMNAFESATTKEIYSFAKASQTCDYRFIAPDNTGEDGAECTLYTYSTNKGLRHAVTGYKSVIFDGAVLSGISGDLTWNLDLDQNTLSFTGSGSSGSYASANDLPYAWASDEVEVVTIGGGVEALGDYVCAGLPYLRKIDNRSSVLASVAKTTFHGSGGSWQYGGKLVDTYVNVSLYDAILALNDELQSNSSTAGELRKKQTQLEQTQAQMDRILDEIAAGGDGSGVLASELERLSEQCSQLEKEIRKLETALTDLEFSFVFRDTEMSCGAGVRFVYDAAKCILTIQGSGKMDAFADDSVVPWKPVNSMVTKIVIGADVKSLSAYAFHHLINLQSVYNYGKGQTISGDASKLFDVITRSGSYENDGSIAFVHVPERSGTTDEAYRAQFATVLEHAASYNLAISEADLMGWTLRCGKETHTHNEVACYTDGEFSCRKEEHQHTDACYEQTGSRAELVPGDYVISKSADKDTILKILSGKELDLAPKPYIVPVYAFSDENTVFAAAVPPVSDGYELRNLYLAKGQCGDSLTYYISLENVLMLEGSGDMWDFSEGGAPWYDHAAKIVSVTYPAGITSIGAFAYEGFDRIRQHMIPDSVTKVGEAAFKDCVNLASFEIPATLKNLGEGVFTGCSRLRIVTSKNPDYRLTDGHLISKDGVLIGYLRETLYEDPVAKTLYTNDTAYQVPEQVKVIGAYSYANASFFYLTIPARVTEIHEKAFHGIETLENVDSLIKAKQLVSSDAFDGCGTLYDQNDAKKYVLLYRINTELETVMAKLGYQVVYHDVKNVTHLTASYTGGAVAVGHSFDKNQVNISLVYENGESENIYGSDSRIIFPSLTVRNVGENIFQAVYNDGYGQILKTNEFVIQGTDAVSQVSFAYTGSYLWYGEPLVRDYLLARVSSASGSMQIVNGNATYATVSGNKNYINLNKTTADKVGDVEFVATYSAPNSDSFTGSFQVRCLNYVTALQAEYTGAPVELAAGADGLELDQLQITIQWADGTSETTTGEDDRIEILSDYQVSGDRLVFEFTVTDGNRYDKVGGFSAKYATNLSSVDFDYIGPAITSGMTFSIADVQLNLHYSDGTNQKTTGEKVVGLAADDMVVHTSDGMEEVNLTYTVGTQEFTGVIHVPGKIRIPEKLTVAKRPTKTVYQTGDVFDPAGMVVNCVYNNGVTEDVTEWVQIVGGDTLSADDTYLVLSYEDIRSGYTVQTNLQINVNQYQKQVSLQKDFKEEHEISRVLFRSKKTEDQSLGENEDTGEDESEDDEDSLGKWQDITPLLTNNVYDADHGAVDADGNELYAAPIIKAGYGFELKVFTRYRTNRAGTEFNAFLKKDLWDSEFESQYPDIDHATFETRWKYLNDVYPQATPTANPDILYCRVINSELVDEHGNPIKNLIGGDGTATDFLVLEKTNLSEVNQEIDEGEWYNSTKVFEFPLRTIVDEEQTRRVYVSKNAADPDKKYTEYELHIISPAWYGYEPEPYFSGDKFHFSTDDGETYARKAYAYTDPQTKYLHVCCGFTIRVIVNDDVKTHILE